MIRWLLGAALTAALFAPGALAHAAPAAFKPGPCPGDFSGQPHKVECGVLSVDESRGTTSPRRVATPVVIVRATEPKGLPPVIYLPGGPGGAVVGGLWRALRSPTAAEYMAVDQDWIFFDPRGAGLASPRLDCGRADLNDAGPLSQGAADTLESCGQVYAAAGIDLARYNTAEVARDVADLKQALSLKSFDLYGGSYGTRLEFGVITHAAPGLRAVVMDSPWPPEATWAQGGPELVSNAVKIIFARCDADPACHAKYPTVQRDFEALAARWLAQPFTKGRRTYTADDLGGFLMDATYSAQGARSLPRDLSKIVAGDMTPLDESIADRSGYDEGQHLAFLCKEEFPFEDRAAVARGAGTDPVARLLVASMQRYFDVCKFYPVGRPDPVEQQPVTSPIPTLFLAAEIDPGCPPQFAEAAAKRFSHSQFVVFPNTTHGVAGRSACARRMIRAFFQDPSKPVDKSCLHPEHDRFVFNLEG